MPAIKISVPHQLGADEARQRIARLISDSKEKFGAQISDVRETWTDNRSDFGFKAMGFDVAGDLRVQPASVDINLNVPFAAMFFRDKIEKEITKHARELLA